MKKYKEYMDGVEVSPELHERLTHLAPAKRPAPWKNTAPWPPPWCWWWVRGPLA